VQGHRADEEEPEDHGRRLDLGGFLNPGTLYNPLRAAAQSAPMRVFRRTA